MVRVVNPVPMVTSAMIVNGTITVEDLGDNCVTSAQLGAASVGSGHIINGTITNNDLGFDCVETAKIKDLNVTPGKLAADVLSGLWEIIGDETTTEAVDRITFTGLDLATDRAYLVLFAIRSTSWGAGEKEYKWFLMGEFTETYYNTQELKVDGASVVAARTNLPITYSLLEDKMLTGHLLLMNSVRLFPTINEQSGQGYETDIKLFNHFCHLVYIANTTQIDIRCLTGAFIRSGSRVIIMKIKS